MSTDHNIAFLSRLTHEGRTIESFKIDTEDLIIGRHPLCSVPMTNPRVSEVHCKITKDPDNNFYIENFEYNYSALNNQYFCRERRLLNNNDLISLDGENFLFSTDPRNPSNTIDENGNFITAYIRPPKPRRKIIKPEVNLPSSRENEPVVEQDEEPVPPPEYTITFGDTIIPYQSEYEFDEQTEYTNNNGHNYLSISNEAENGWENMSNTDNNSKKSSDEVPSNSEDMDEFIESLSSDFESSTSPDERSMDSNQIRLPFEWLIVCEGQTRKSSSNRNDLKNNYFCKRVFTNEDGSYRPFMNMSNFKIPRKIMNPRKHIITRKITLQNSPINSPVENEEEDENLTKPESPIESVESESPKNLPVDPEPEAITPRKRGRKKMVKSEDHVPTLDVARGRGRRIIRPRITPTRIPEPHSPSPPRPKLRGRPPKLRRGGRNLKTVISSGTDRRGCSGYKFGRKDN